MSIYRKTNSNSSSPGRTDYIYNCEYVKQLHLIDGCSNLPAQIQLYRSRPVHELASIRISCVEPWVHCLEPVRPEMIDWKSRVGSAVTFIRHTHLTSQKASASLATSPGEVKQAVTSGLSLNLTSNFSIWCNHVCGSNARFASTALRLLVHLAV